MIVPRFLEGDSALITAPQTVACLRDGMRAMATMYVLVDQALTSAHIPMAGGRVLGWYRYPFSWALWGHFGATVFIVLAGYSLALGVARHDGKLPGGVLGGVPEAAYLADRSALLDRADDDDRAQHAVPASIHRHALGPVAPHQP